MIYSSTPMDTYRNFIGGKWIESASTRTAQNINPANTDDVIGTIRQATREEARSAVEAAAEAFRGWRSTPAPARGRIVAKAARLLEENKEELAQLLTHEEGKTIAESRGELQRSINVAEFCAGESRRMTGETIPSELPLNFAYTIKQPLGVVACVTPWNFPVAIPIWKIAPALVAGNTVVFKPASITPATAVRIAEIFEAAGIPPGVLNLVIGSGPKRATRSSIIRRQSDLVHRIERRRHSTLRTGFATRREGPMRDGRKESGRHSRRRRHGPGRGIDGAGRVWIVRSTMHRDEPRGGGPDRR